MWLWVTMEVDRALPGSWTRSLSRRANKRCTTSRSTGRFASQANMGLNSTVRFFRSFKNVSGGGV